MALVNLLFETKRAEVDLITVDVVLTEQHTSEVEVTEHPVETGANIVDHARPKPDVLMMEGLISDDPMPEPADVAVAQQYLGANYATRSQRREGRAGQGYEDLLALKNAGRLFTVATAIRTYENMILRSLSVPRDPRTGQALRFSATFIEVRIVSNKEVAIEAKPKTDTGKRAAPTAPEAQKSTVLHDLGDVTGATGFIKSMLGG